jgi:hypothetical protein
VLVALAGTDDGAIASRAGVRAPALLLLGLLHHALGGQMIGAPTETTLDPQIA